MNIYTVYRSINKINGKSYIGFDSNFPKRKFEHNSSYSSEDTVFYRAIRKHGWENFEWEIIYQSKELEHTKNIMENYFINEYETYIHFENSCGYNMTLGGDGTLGNRQTDLTKKKRKETNLKKFGVECALKLPEIKEKRKETCLERYGVTCALKFPEIKEKAKNTCLERYGFDNPAKSPQVKDKIKNTCLERYGYEYALQVPDIIQQRKETCLEKYGVEHISRIPEFQENKRITCLEKYGVDNPSKVPETKEKAKKTNLEKYGVEYHNQQLVTCPWCDKTGGKLGMLTQHFEFCSKNPNRIINIIKCPECGKEGIENNSFKGNHFNNCKEHKNYKKKEYKIIICSECGKEGLDNSAFKGHHFKNCKERKNNGTSQENT